MKKEELFTKLQDELPERFLQAIYKTIPNIYEDTFKQAKINYPPGTRENYLPYLRWAEIEKFLFELGKSFPEILVTPIRNNASNWSFYLLETNSFRFTVSKSCGESTKPREAKFRGDFGQIDLWEKEINKINSKVYMTLVHGSKRSFSGKPEFIYFYIPGTGNILFIDLIQSTVDESYEINERQYIEKLPILKNTGSD